MAMNKLLCSSDTIQGFLKRGPLFTRWELTLEADLTARETEGSASPVSPVTEPQVCDMVLGFV